MIFDIFFILLITVSVWLAVKISIADLRRRIIPDAYLFPFMLCGLALTTFFNFPTDISNGVIGGAFGYIMAIAIGLIFSRAKRNQDSEFPPIGMGDIKLIGVGGLMAGIAGSGDCTNIRMPGRCDLGAHTSPKIHTICTIFSGGWIFIFPNKSNFDIIIHTGTQT